MRWPFVSRATYDRDTDNLIKSQGSLVVQNEWLRDAYDRLSDKYHALKLSGASIPEKLEPIAPKEPDVVTQAIIAKSRGNPLLRKHYFEYVAEQRGLKVAEDKIAEAIMRGQDDDMGVPG